MPHAPILHMSWSPSMDYISQDASWQLRWMQINGHLTWNEIITFGFSWWNTENILAKNQHGPLENLDFVENTIFCWKNVLTQNSRQGLRAIKWHIPGWSMEIMFNDIRTALFRESYMNTWHRDYDCMGRGTMSFPGTCGQHARKESFLPHCITPASDVRTRGNVTLQTGIFNTA